MNVVIREMVLPGGTTIWTEESAFDATSNENSDTQVGENEAAVLELKPYR
jgi:hypothetical protein